MSMIKKYWPFYIVVIVGLVAILAAALWPKTKLISPLEAEVLVDKVDINITADYRQKLEKDIVEIQDKINRGDVGEAANLGPLYSSLGLRYDSLGELGKARQAFLQAIKIDSKEGIHWANLSDTYIRMKAYLHAEEALYKTLELNSGFEEYWSKLLELEENALRPEEKEMRNLFSKALQSTKRNMNIVSRFASYLDKIDKNEEALTLWQELVTRDPDNQAYQQEVERLRAKLGK